MAAPDPHPLDVPGTPPAPRRSTSPAAAARTALAGVDTALERARPVLAVAGEGLRVAGVVAAVGAVAGAAGALLVVAALWHWAGWLGGLVGALTLVLPWRAWALGTAARGAGRLLLDPARLTAAVRASAANGRDWTGYLRTIGGQVGRRRLPAARAVLGAGRSLWRVLSPDIEGVGDVRSLLEWPKTVSGLVAVGLCLVLFAVGAVLGLLALVL